MRRGKKEPWSSAEDSVGRGNDDDGDEGVSAFSRVGVARAATKRGEGDDAFLFDDAATKSEAAEAGAEEADERARARGMRNADGVDDDDDDELELDVDVDAFEQQLRPAALIIIEQQRLAIFAPFVLAFLFALCVER